MGLLSNHHEISFGLTIGGKSIEEEQKEISKMNIIISTPGRLLQHLSDTVDFSLDNLQMLVLDEADEILSKGFENTIQDIFSYINLGQT